VNTISTRANSTSSTTCLRTESNLNRTFCIPCQPGKYLDALACKACNNGTYSSAEQAPFCSLCPVGKFTLFSGSSYCFDCPGGKQGSLRSDSNNIVTECNICPSGKYSTLDTEMKCISCPIGKVSSVGSTRCDFCSSGKYPFSYSECKVCPLGQFSSSNETSCSFCPSGKFSDQEGTSFCGDCPINSTSNIASSAIMDCFCTSGFYGVVNFSNSSCSTCSSVPEGMSCPPNSSIPKVSPGYYRDPLNFMNAFPCIPREACLETTYLVTNCSSLYTGYVCGDCIPLLSFRRGRICKECPSLVSKVLTIIGLIILIGFISWRLARNLREIPLEVKMCFSAIQTIALFPSFFSSWPDNLSSVMHVISFTVMILQCCISFLIFFLEF
jgi:hypothetical protein